MAPVMSAFGWKADMENPVNNVITSYSIHYTKLYDDLTRREFQLLSVIEARRHVHAVAQDVVAVDDDLAQIDADTVGDAALGGHVRLALGHAPLHRDRAQDRVDRAAKLDQEPVAGGLDDAPVVLSYLGVSYNFV